jgi:hypothetical protein
MQLALIGKISPSNETASALVRSFKLLALLTVPRQK